MREFRRHSRVATEDIDATVVAGSAPGRRLHVVDISEGGLRVEGLDLAVGTEFDFTLEGDGIDCRGAGHVVHRSPTTTGVEVDEWIGGGQQVHQYVMTHLLSEIARSDLYICDWA